MDGGADATDLDKLSDKVTMALTAGADKVDFAKFLADAQAKGWTTGDLVHFFDVRQGARLSTLFGPDFLKNKTAVEAAVRGMSGRGSFLDKMYAMQMKGAVGPWERMKQGFGNVFIAMAESGAMDTIANGLNSIANGLMSLSKSSPALLKFVTYTILAAAVLAPLGFAFSGLVAGLRLLAVPLRLIAPAWRLLFSSVGAAGPRIPLIIRLGRAFGALGRFALPLRVGLMMLARLGFGALLAATWPVAAGILAVGAAIAFIIAKWSGIKAFFAGFADGFRKAVPPEARAALVRAGSAILNLASYLNPVTLAFKFFGGVLSTVFGWLGKIFAPAEVGKWRSWGEAAGAAVGGVVRWLGNLIGKIEGAIRKFRELTNLKVAPDSGIGRVLNGARAGFKVGGVMGGITGAAVGAGQALAGKRASGGSVAGGKPYLIGERGPEVMVPGRSGTVVPAHALAAMQRLGARPLIANDNGKRRNPTHPSAGTMPLGRVAALFGAMSAAAAPLPLAAAPVALPAVNVAAPAAAAIALPDINLAPAPPTEPTVNVIEADDEAPAPEVAFTPPPPRPPHPPMGAAMTNTFNINISIDGAGEPQMTAVAVRREIEAFVRKLAGGQSALLSD
jgi:hypothetical protein